VIGVRKPTSPQTASRGRPLRVLHVLTEPRGGGGVHAWQLVAAGRDRGDAVGLAVPTLRRSPEPGRLTPRRLTSAVRQADIIHCHGVRSALVTPPTGRTRMIVTTHGLHGLRAPDGPRASLLRKLSSFALARADRIVCVSRDDARVVSALSDRLAGRSVTILNGVAPAPLPAPADRDGARAALGIPPTQPILLFVGSLIHQKHPELAVAAVQRARVALPDLVLLVAGDGPLMPDLRRMAGPGVELLGMRDDVDRLLTACDAVINTSRWEGLSLALLEALWRGRPIVATDAPGNPEAVGDGGIVAPADAVALADAVVRLLTEPGLLDHLGGRARARAEREFDARRMVEATLALQTEVAG
jgi:glycosyltransferase involved in cell wall biosynthesis